MALVVLTGGARCGKSAAAERLAALREMDGASVCVAVFGRIEPSDTEFAARVAKHRASRPVGWHTIEALDATGWLAQVPGDALLLVDCVGTLLGLVMDDVYRTYAHADSELGYAESVREAFDPIVEAIIARTSDTIVVTNEVGDGIVPAYASGRLFRDILGNANRRLVAASDSAYLVVAGRYMALSDLPSAITWPHD